MDSNSWIETSDETEEQEQRANKNILTAAKGGSILFAGRLFGYASRLIFGIILGRTLGAEGLGLYTIGLTTVTILAVFGRLGLSEGIIHFLPAAIQKKDDRLTWGIIQIGVLISTILSILLGLILYLFAEFLAVRLFNDPAVAQILRWMSLAVPLVSIGRILMATMRALNFMQYQVYADSIAFNITRIVLTIVLLALGWGLSGAIIAYVLAWVVVNGLLLFFLNRIFSLKQSRRKAEYNIRELLTFSFPLLLSQLVERMRGSFELLMLGILSTIATVGIYSVAIRIQMIGGMFLTAAEGVAKPIISDLYHQQELNQLRRIYQTLTRWSFSFILPYFITLIIFADPILAIFGEEFREGKAVLLIVGFGTLVNAATGICGAMVVMTGNSKMAFLNSFIAVIISVALNIMLIPVFGLIGAAISFAITLILVNLLRLVEVYWLFKFMPYSKEYYKPILAGFISFAIGYLFNILIIPGENILLLLIDISMLWITYILGIVLLGVTDEDRVILDKIANRFKRKFIKR